MSEEIKSTPDISRIISVIMENPELIEQISALAAEKQEETPQKDEKPEEIVSTATIPTGAGIHNRREYLLAALKPYLSDERQKAIDSMMTFADILDAVRRK